MLERIVDWAPALQGGQVALAGRSQPSVPLPVSAGSGSRGVSVGCKLAEMQVTNKLQPSDEQRQRIVSEAGPDGPIVMVNLLKFRDRAVYEDGSDSHLSGREAYQRYGAAVGKLIRGYGGRFVFVGDVTDLMIGDADEKWDEVALAEYPDRASLAAMISSPEFQAAEHHREAGLEGQLNIETTWLPAFQRNR